MDGEVIIGTSLNTKQLEKDLKSAEKKLEKFESDSKKLTEQKLKIEAEVDVKAQEVERKIKEIQQKAKIDIQAISGGTPYARMMKEQKIQETAQMKINSLQEQWVQYLDISDAKLNDINNKIKNNADNQDKLNKKIFEMKEKLKQTKGFENIKNLIQGIGSGIESATKKVAKWALAIFGVRSAINFVRNSIATLSQYNEQMGVDIDYIRYLLASTLQKTIENIIQLVYKLLTYINYIADAWFKVNLFENASVEAFQKQNKALGGSVKKAKELQKTLTGFDEMNVLQDNGDVGSGGGGGGVSLPSFPSMEDVPIPSWLQWIVDNKDLVIAGLSGIAVGLTALKLGFKGIQALGIGAIVLGIVNLISDIIDFINDPSWENFVAILGDIATVIGGIMLVMGNWWGLLVILVGAAVKLIAENWDAIKGILGKIGGWIYDTVLKPVIDSVKRVIDIAKEEFKLGIDTIKSWFNGMVNFFSAAIGKIIGLFQTIGTTVGNVIASAFKGVVNDVLSAIENILNFPINSINGLIGVINKVPGINLGYLSTFSLPRLAKGGIINQPGRGVQLGSAIGGERGQEGVIPLTDSQQMELLGESIGRYITINANITNNMNGRTISRELQKIQNRDNFLYNR